MDAAVAALDQKTASFDFGKYFNDRVSFSFTLAGNHFQQHENRLKATLETEGSSSGSYAADSV